MFLSKKKNLQWKRVSRSGRINIYETTNLYVNNLSRSRESRDKNWQVYFEKGDGRSVGEIWGNFGRRNWKNEVSFWFSVTTKTLSTAKRSGDTCDWQICNPTPNQHPKDSDLRGNWQPLATFYNFVFLIENKNNFTRKITGIRRISYHNIIINKARRGRWEGFSIFIFGFRVVFNYNFAFIFNLSFNNL